MTNHGKIREIFDTLSALMSELPESGGIRYVRVFIRYIAATQERKTVEEFTGIMKIATTNKTGKKPLPRRCTGQA